MIGGQGLSTALERGDGMIGGFGTMALGGALKSLFSGDMLGTVNNSSGSSSGTSTFDSRQLPAFNQSLQGSDEASRRLMELIRQLGGQRSAALQGNLDEQIASVRGMGGQALSDINRRYNSAQGGVGQNLANRGLYNSTVAPGMQALVNRERNSALGQENDRQRQYFGGLLGQRASMLDQALASQNAALAQVGSQDYGLRTLLPQAIASSRVTSQQNQEKQKRGGFLSGIFG